MSDSQQPGSRAESIADGLRSQILGGKYDAGERLPSERDLAARLGVHRSSVREALKRLEQEGLIAIRRGGGARVVPLEDAGLSVLQHLFDAGGDSDPELVAQWLDVHELVIAGALRFAVERGTDGEMREAMILLDRLVVPEASDDEVIAILDELTELTARASRNVVLRMVRNGLTAQLEARHRLRQQYRPPHDQLVALVDAVRGALQARDGAAAAEAVRSLLREQRQDALERVAAKARA